MILEKLGMEPVYFMVQPQYFRGIYTIMTLWQNAGFNALVFIAVSYTHLHVLLAIGLPHEIAHGSLRLTLNSDNTMEEMDYVVESIKKIVEKLRSMSPLYEDFVKRQNR